MRISSKMAVAPAVMKFRKVTVPRSKFCLTAGLLGSGRPGVGSTYSVITSVSAGPLKLNFTTNTSRDGLDIRQHFVASCVDDVRDRSAREVQETPGKGGQRFVNSSDPYGACQGATRSRKRSA